MAINTMMFRCFAAVAETGNLSDAGARLGRTPSAISMTLKHLEEHLGTQLFETDRKNRLSPLGEEIFGLAQQQLCQFDDTVETIETLARAPKGLLRIASIPSAAHQGLVSAVNIMMKRRPALQIDMRDADTDSVKRALLDGQVDIGVVSGRPDLNGFRRLPLFQDAFGLVAENDHPLIIRAHAPELDDLAATEFVRNDLCAGIRSVTFQKFLGTTRVAARNTVSLISMVRTRRWVTVLPEAVVGILPERLKFRTILGLDENREVSLLVREQSLFPALVQEFAEIMKELDWSNAHCTTQNAL